MAKPSYLVLARKWRPQTFDEVVGQEHITRTLQNAIRSGRIGHAFLFVGSRGIGKTTTARILAKALNCGAADAPTPTPCCACENCLTIAAGNNIDVIEIDGASNNSVDDVREIREHVRLVPSSSRFKIYVIDEVHQLSLPAFNALLKTLEEPPPHAVFILATTEVHRIPATIISRCQRYDFRRVGLNTLCGLLRRILDAEGLACSDEALYAIARAADGGVRDAESILDQLVSYCRDEITFQDVFDVLGLVDWRVLHALCRAVHDKDVAKLLEIVDDVVVNGKDLAQFVQEILQFFRNLLVCKTDEPEKLLALPAEEIAELRQSAERFTLTEIIRLIEQFAELTKGFDSQHAQRVALETLLIRIATVAIEISVDTVLEKLVQLGQGGVSSHGQAVGPRLAAQRKTEPVKQTMAQPNMAEVWADVVERIAESSMPLRLWLRHARPARVDGDALELELDAAQPQICDELEKPENRAAIEAALDALTTNVSTYRCALAILENHETPTHNVPSANPPPKSAGERAEAARQAMEDPHIAEVVETFKGNIIAVKENVAPPHEE
ncbi:MAG TPA: DNA polymerase III subunit gamma/tau [Candidatus Hydrogenedentes bacterium]|nr:DNA polymerase III subunit gamma/tau [Candidatus Hydrogenedentota bacterium]